MQSADGSTRIYTSSSGCLIFERVADQTVLWSSGGQPQAAGVVDDDAAARGLFLQVIRYVSASLQCRPVQALHAAQLITIFSLILSICQ
jgi:hypothetical protein